MRALLRPSLALCLAAGLATAAGCASASGAYRDGMEAETGGDFDAAVGRYATALRRDASLPNVRGRLVVASREAVRRHLSTAATAPDAMATADAWLAADAVVAQAREVGVEAERPPTFAADRDRALDDAVYEGLARAAADVDRRDYAGSLARLDGLRRYRPSRERQAELDATARTAYHYWADDDLAAGRYRDALVHADAALGLGGPGAPGGADLASLRDEILLAGERRVAVLPADADGGAYPDRWLRDLDDALDEATGAAGAPFLAFADPADVRRAMRERGTSRVAIAGAARVAERVGADLAVLVRLDDPDETTRATDRRRIGARLRGSRDTTSYVRLTTELRLSAGAEITVVDAVSRQPVCSETLRESATDSFRDGRFSGTWRSLDLDRSERDLFDDGLRERAYDRALSALRDRLADRVAEQSVVCLSRQIP